MKIDLPPLDHTPPPSGDVEHFLLALRRARARLNENDRLRTESLGRLRDRQRITFSDRYPLREYSAGAPNEEREPRGADDTDNNKEVNL